MKRNYVMSEFTGEPVDTWSEAWRHECECRHIMNMPSAEHRNKHMQVIARIRGDAAAYRIQLDVCVLFLLRQPTEQWEDYRKMFEERQGVAFADHVIEKSIECLERRAAAESERAAPHERPSDESCWLDCSE